MTPRIRSCRAYQLVPLPVPAVANRWALTFLRTHTDLEEHTYPRMGHSVSMDEISDLAKFLQKVLVAG